MYRNLDMALRAKEGLVWAIESSDVPQEQIEQSSSSSEDDEEREWNAQIERNMNDRRDGWSSSVHVFIHLIFMFNRTTLLYIFFSLCIKYGFYQFTLIYTFLIFMVTVPIMLILLVIGQYSGQSIVNCWEFLPILKGVGVCLMLFSVAQTTTEFILSGQSVYLAVALQGVKSLPTMLTRCDYAERTAYCNNYIEVPETSRHCNFSYIKQRGLYYVFRDDWGQCGFIRVSLGGGFTLEDQMYAHNWQRVDIFNMRRAKRTFRYGRTPVADILYGRMRLGFSTEPAAGKLHSTYFTFSVMVAYVAYLLALLLPDTALRVLHHALHIISALAMAVLAFFIFLKFNSDWQLIFYNLVAWLPEQKSIFRQYYAWVEALLLILWTCGATNGDLIHLGSKSTWNCSYFLMLFGALLLHVGRNALAVWTFLWMLESSTERTLMQRTTGFLDLMFEAHPQLLLQKLGYFGLVPLACVVMESVALFFNQSQKILEGVRTLIPASTAWSSMSYTSLFAIMIFISRVVCAEYSNGNVYALVETHWGWHSLGLVIIQLMALWCFTSKEGFLSMLRIMGASVNITQFSLWLRLAWEGYTSFAMFIAVGILAYVGASRVFGSRVKKYGLLYLPDATEDTDVTPSAFLITLLRLMTLTPIVLLPVLLVVIRFYHFGSYEYSRAVLQLTSTRNSLWKSVRNHGALMERIFMRLQNVLVKCLVGRCGAGGVSSVTDSSRSTASTSRTGSGSRNRGTGSTRTGTGSTRTGSRSATKTASRSSTERRRRSGRRRR